MFWHVDELQHQYWKKKGCELEPIFAVVIDNFWEVRINLIFQNKSTYVQWLCKIFRARVKEIIKAYDTFGLGKSLTNLGNMGSDQINIKWKNPPIGTHITSSIVIQQPE